MSTQKTSILEPLRVRVRRIQFTVGLGFLALVVGSVLTGSLSLRLGGRVGVLPSWLIDFVLAPALRHLWALAVLPVLCYGAARIIELRPWATALGAAATGLCFTLAVELTTHGVDGWLAAGGLSLVWEGGVIAGGVVLSQRAIVRGRAEAGRQEQQARQQASARQDEYAEFLREAERAGEESARREAAKAGEQAEQQPQGGPKAPAA